MTGKDSADIKNAIIHKIGNPARGEALILSKDALSLNDIVVKDLLKQYFLKPFNENEQYHFTHLSDLNLNEVYTYAAEIFTNHKAFLKNAALIAQFLYGKSTHANIKEGELYVVLFENIAINGAYTEALGIFKSESNETYLRIFKHGSSFEVGAEQGIDIHKLDKGCLIFNVQKNDGFVVCVTDSNKEEAQYWKHEFLQVQKAGNEYNQTHDAMDLCKKFITGHYAENFEVSRFDQLDLINRSMDFFKSKEQFNVKDYKEEVLYHEAVIDAFSEFKQHYESGKQTVIEDEFEIHVAAVKKQQRLFKSVLKLDKNFHVYIHGRRELIEKGIDEQTGKKFYKLYYDEEF